MQLTVAAAAETKPICLRLSCQGGVCREACFKENFKGCALLHHKLKDQRMRPEGGECEAIKISLRNLDYILNLIRRTSLLTRSRPRSYQKATSPRNQVSDRNHNRRQNSMHRKSQAQFRQSKSDELTYIYFIKQLTAETKTSPQEFNENKKNSSI
jgi:hypothetical protein